MEKLKSKLFEAATQNSITSLHQLLEDYPLILERCFVNSFNETPLHVAAMLGHVDFVKKIIEINPQLVHELDQQKRSPLHLAAAEGHVEVVTALLSVSQITCFARDRNGLTPVHLAAMKGRGAAVKLLLEAQPDAARKLVYEDEETILHLCVKNHQLKTLKLIVAMLNDPEFVNSKDAHGNTALHLAVVDKQVETTEFLVSMGAKAVEVNAQNFLVSMGAKAVEVKAQNRNTSSNKHSSDSEIRRASEGIMVVAVLLAGMIFQSATNPPGGVWQEDNFLMDSRGNYVDPQGQRVSYPVDEKNNTVPYPRQAGYSVLARNHPTPYMVLCYCNTIGFTACLVVILFLIAGAPSNRLLMLVFYLISFFAFVAVTTTYVYSVSALTPTGIGFPGIKLVLILQLLIIITLSVIFNSHVHWKSVNESLNRLLLQRRPKEVAEDTSETETGRILGRHVSSSAV